MPDASSSSPSPRSDVRMRGFASRTTVPDALKWLDEHCEQLEHEDVPLREAGGRVLARSISSPVDVPGFDRGMMDGFAIRAADSQGASAYNPLPLKVIGEALPGQPYGGSAIQTGQAVRVMTGAALPEGADAVLPVEKTRPDESGGTVHALEAVPPGKHVGRPGEDIAAGSQVLPAGRQLRPQDVGVLSSIGCPSIAVVRRPRVRIVVTGDELLPPGTRPTGFRIADANSPMLETLIRRDGGIAIHPGIVPDRPDAILEALRDDADVVLVSGGSSVGQEDHAPVLLAEHGELAIHGIAMRPSSPTGMGRLEHRLVVLLPGNPVSCLCAYDFFGGRAIRSLGGRERSWPYRSRRLPLARKITSVVGRLDYARVRVEKDRVEPLAISGASILSSTTQADGFVIIDSDQEGYPPGQDVEVHFYD